MPRKIKEADTAQKQEERDREEDANVEGEYERAEGPWNAVTETHFFDAVELYPPTGAHKHINLLSIRCHLRRCTGVEFTPAQLLARVQYYWDLDETPATTAAADDASSSSSSAASDEDDAGTEDAIAFSLPDDWHNLKDRRFPNRESTSPSTTRRKK